MFNCTCIFCVEGTEHPILPIHRRFISVPIHLLKSLGLVESNAFVIECCVVCGHLQKRKRIKQKRFGYA